MYVDEDGAYGDYPSENNALWLNSPTAVNVTMNAGTMLSPAFYFGPDESSRRMGLYLPAENLWCVLQIHNPPDSGGIEFATMTQATVAGSVWVAPANMREPLLY